MRKIIKKILSKRRSKPDNEIPSVKDGNVRSIKKKEKLGFWNKRKLNKSPESSFLITFLFSNGTSKQFVIATLQETFEYKKRTYHLDYEEAWFDLNYNQYRLYYFDDCCTPINREIIKKGSESYFSVTPENLKPLLKMEYVKALAQSHEISKYLKLMVLVGFFNLLLAIVIVYLVYNLGRAA